MRDPRTQQLIRAYDVLKPKTFNDEEVVLAPMPPHFGPWVHVGIIVCLLSACLVGWGAGYVFDYVIHRIGGVR